MYTEEYERRGFPIRSFILKIILIIIFIFLLIWLLPKFISPKSAIKNCKGSTCETSQKLTSKSQVFSNNMQKMKDAAISYYTDENLPKENGNSEQMNLKEMIKKKIIATLIDKNNKECDQEESYIKISKENDEYILKVNLKDSEKEDYMLVHLGAYTYCNSYLCEKKATDTQVNDSQVIEKVPIKGTIKNGEYYTSTAKQNNNKKKTTSSKILICKYRNGKYYGKNGKVVSKSEYKKQCKSTKKSSKKYCTKSNGKYYGSDGKEVTENEYKKQCEPEEENHYCVKYNEKYYDKEGKEVTESEYKRECETTEPTEEEQKQEDVEYYEQAPEEYIYEYMKITNLSFSNWSKWTKWSKTSCDTKEVNCNDSDATCLKKVQTYKRKEKIGTYEKTYYKTKDVTKQTGTYQKKVCTKKTASNKCSKYTYKTVPIYETETVTEKETKTEPLYGDVCYQSIKTRTLLNEEKTTTTWSKYDDKELLNSDWYYTGNKKLK